jgi:holo-[acyl-carrier protein] synthase
MPREVHLMLIVGVDIIEIDRIAQALDRWKERFLQRVYTPKETAFCQGRPDRLAARFAAKEAVMKALGTGIRGIGWKDVEVNRQNGKPPTIHLYGRARRHAISLGIVELSLSMSHSKSYAVASVVGSRQ